jgi:hypothetical protein
MKGVETVKKKYVITMSKGYCLKRMLLMSEQFVKKALFGSLQSCGPVRFAILCVCTAALQEVIGQSLSCNTPRSTWAEDGRRH